MKRYVGFTIQLRPEQFEAIERISRSSGAGLSEIARRALDMFLGTASLDPVYRPPEELHRGSPSEVDALGVKQLEQVLSILRELPDELFPYQFERAQLREAMRLVRELPPLRRLRQRIASAAGSAHNPRRRANRIARQAPEKPLEKGDIETAA